MLDRLFASIVKKGTLILHTADGRRTSFGAGAPEITMRLHDRSSYYELALNPELKLGELYMDGRLTVENGDIADLLDLLMSNLALAQPGGGMELHPPLAIDDAAVEATQSFGAVAQECRAPLRSSGKLYDLFLDRDRQYSCAYFSAPGETLDEAQIGKKRHIAAKLYLHRTGPERPGYRFRLGRARARSGAGLRRQGSGRDACPKSKSRSRASGREGRTCRTLQVRARGLSRARRHLRPHRFGRHVRACGRALLSRVFRESARSC